MADSFDMKPPRSGPDPILVAISLVMVVVLGIAGYMAVSTTKANREKEDLNRQVASLTEELQKKEDELVAARGEVESLVKDYEGKIAQSNKEWTERLATTQADQEKRLRNYHETVSQIVNESGTTMNLMKDLETKMKAGQALQAKEVEQLKSMASGLAYLHQQYERPIHEFRELDSFLANQLQAQTVPPDQRGKFFKNLFSKDYREQMSQYYQDVGRRDAIETTREQVSMAYQRAQQEMSTIRVNTQQYLASLDSIIGQKKQTSAALDSFFTTSQEILKIHQRVMNVDLGAPPVVSTSEPVRP